MRLKKPELLRDFMAGGPRRTISETSSKIRPKTECPEAIDGGGSPEPAPSDIETAAGVHEEGSGANGAEPKSVALQNLLSCFECSRTFRTLSAIRSDPVRAHKVFSSSMMLRRGKVMPCKQLPEPRRSHARTHSGEKPFACPICLRRFSEKSNMKVPFRMHLITMSAC